MLMTQKKAYKNAEKYVISKKALMIILIKFIGGSSLFIIISPLSLGSY